jgi:hypothetical protein
MLGRWFGRSNRLTHEDSEERLKAIGALSDTEAQDAQATLADLAANDAVLAVRVAAIERIGSADALAPLLDDDTVADSAAKAIASLVAAGQRSAHASHPCVLSARIQAATGDTLGDLIPSISEPTQAAELALRLTGEAREQVFALDCLRAEDGLVILEKLSRGRDKGCNRHARAQLDALKRSRTNLGAARERLIELDASITKELNHHPQDADTLIVHRQKLARLKEMRSGAVDEVETALAALEEISGEAPAIPIAPDPLAGADLTIPDPANDPFAPLVSELEALEAKMRAAEALDPITQVRDRLTEDWLKHADSQPPSQTQHEVFNRVSHQYQEYRAAWARMPAFEPASAPSALPDDLADAPIKPLLNERTQWAKRASKALKTLAWPKDHELPGSVTDFTSEDSRVRREIETLKARQAANDERIDALTRELRNSIDAGHIDAARTNLRNIRHLQKAGTRGDEHDINTLAARFDELKDWQSFATHPKRDELLKAIAELAENPLEPPAQADRLRELRAAWNQLGRPVSPTEVEEQHAFDGYADEAFKVCKAYYEEQNAVRAENLRARQGLCNDLRTYLAETDWANADMKAAETILRQARQEWRKFHPCERKALKPVEADFETLQAELHGKVKSAWDANAASKRALVERANALLESDDLMASIESAKSLQREWREVGPVPRGVDQRLWREFRKACDDIFGRRDAQHQAENAARAEQRKSLDAQVAAFAQAAEGSEAVSAGDLRRFLDEIESSARNLTLDPQTRQTIRATESAFRKRLEQQANAKAERDLLIYRDWDVVVSQAEQRGETIEPPHSLFVKRLNDASNHEDLARLTIEAEIAADLPSPASDQAMRMALQVELMNQGVRNFDNIDNRDFLARWCGQGPKDAAADRLRERFFAALAKRL